MAEAAEAHRATAAAVIPIFRQDRGFRDMDSDLANAGRVFENPRTFQILGGDLEGLSP
jgi:hypothetical protein